MHRVKLSNLARRKLDILLDYLEDEWSLTVANNFEELFEEKLIHISSYPESCIESGIFNNLRKCIVTKQTSFLYRINKNEFIEIITVFDNRSSFKSINKEIRKHYGDVPKKQ